MILGTTRRNNADQLGSPALVPTLNRGIRYKSGDSDL